MPSLPTPDLLADRRVLTRKLTFWRAAAVGVAIAAAVGAGLYGARRGSGEGGEQVARIKVSGLITGDDDTVKLIRSVANAARVKAALVVIESPGGTTAGSERLYNEIRKLSAKKPVVALVGTMAASGGYIAALAADQIVAQETSIVGSIGVIFQNPNVSRTLDMLGVKIEEIKSSPLKASPNPYSTTSEEARAAMRAMVEDSYDWFKGLVRERRGLDGAALAAVADGRIFTGRQGLPLKLIDRLGAESEARKWLAQAKDVPESLPARDWKPKSGALERLGLSEALAVALAAAGWGELASALRSDAFAVSKLDGLLAVWQGPAP
jgi:protease-4